MFKVVMFHQLLKNRDFYTGWMLSIEIYPVGRLLKIAVGAFVDINEFLRVPVDKGEP